MKLALASDIHLEFGDLDLKNEENADVLILSGDICVARELPFTDSDKGLRFRDFFARCSLEFPHVVMISGNHESYHGDIAKTHEILKEATEYHPNFHVLEKETVKIDDVTFIGGTLWSDMNKEDPMTLYSVGTMMNDFRIIANSNRMVSFKDQDGKFHERISKFSTEDAVQEHKKSLDYIKAVVDGKPDEKFVVVGHHAPSKLSTKPQYEKDVLMNGGYSSDLNDFITDRSQIKVWTHGHTHHKFDYMVGSTRVICNPRGYINYEPQADEFKLQYFEV